jgi:hypothetical protein
MIHASAAIAGRHNNHSVKTQYRIRQLAMGSANYHWESHERGTASTTGGEGKTSELAFERRKVGTRRAEADFPGGPRGRTLAPDGI